MALNPALYKSLSDIARKLHLGEVRVVDEGAEFIGAVERTPYGPKIEVAQGEEYQMCCPFCGDERHRFYVSYMYGMPSPFAQLPGEMRMLAYCQNEQKCHGARLKGLLKSTDYNTLIDKGLVVIRVDEIQKDQVFRPPPPMGVLKGLDKLDSDHQACRYLRGRGYSPDYLAKVYGASVVVEHPDDRLGRILQDRIMFPFYIDGEVKAWQARLQWDPGKDYRGVPKWFSSGGSKVLYNVDNASKYEACVVAEAVLDAINFGPAGIAVCGKTIMPSMAKLIAERWKYVMVAFDPDAGVNRKIGENDYQTRAIQRLRDYGVPHVSGAVWDRGNNADPGDLGKLGCAQLVLRSDRIVYSRLPYYRNLPNACAS